MKQLVENQKYVLITGASSGIGQASCFMLSENGFKVFAGVRKKSDAETLQEKENIIPVFIDVNDHGSVDRAFSEVSQICGEDGLFALVNNAGVAVAGPLEFLSIDKFRFQMETNVIGQVKVTQAFLPLIRLGAGRIINISSIAGFTAFPFNGAYCASKHAIEAITDCLRRELSPWKIPVCAISPGVIKTNIWERSLNLLDECMSEMPEGAKKYYAPFCEPLIEKTRKKVAKNAIFPENVAKVVLKAITVKNPAPRYLAGKDAEFLNKIKFLPKKLLDTVICTRSGLNEIKK